MNLKQILLRNALAGALALSSVSCRDLYLDFMYSSKKVSEMNLSSELESKLFELNTTEEVVKLVYDNIEYVNDDIHGPRWQPPQETLDYKKGDCEDFSLLTMKLLNIRFELKPGLVFFLTFWGSKHAVIRDDNNYYDPTLGRKINMYGNRIVEVFSYEGAFEQLAEYIREENDWDNEPIYYKSISGGQDLKQALCSSSIKDEFVELCR